MECLQVGNDVLSGAGVVVLDAVLDVGQRVQYDRLRFCVVDLGDVVHVQPAVLLPDDVQRPQVVQQILPVNSGDLAAVYVVAHDHLQHFPGQSLHVLRHVLDVGFVEDELCHPGDVRVNHLPQLLVRLHHLPGLLILCNLLFPLLLFFQQVLRVFGFQLLDQLPLLALPQRGFALLGQRVVVADGLLDFALHLVRHADGQLALIHQSGQLGLHGVQLLRAAGNARGHLVDEFVHGFQNLHGSRILWRVHADGRNPALQVHDHFVDIVPVLLRAAHLLLLVLYEADQLVHLFQLGGVPVEFRRDVAQLFPGSAVQADFAVLGRPHLNAGSGEEAAEFLQAAVAAQEFLHLAFAQLYHGPAQALE